MNSDNANNEREWAEQRPAMFLGPSDHAHRMAVSQALRLASHSYAFKSPKRVDVVLAPNQYTVRSTSGPLRDEVASRFTFSENKRFFDSWSEDNGSIVKERDNLKFACKGRGRNWVTSLGGPVGPSLMSPLHALTLATRYFFGIKTRNGIWCQSFYRNVPSGDPVVLHSRSRFGFVVAAELDPAWFTGLPFTVSDLGPLLDSEGITAVWHPENDLVSDEELGAAQYAKWFV